MSDIITVTRHEDGVAEIVMDDAAHNNRLSEELCTTLMACLSGVAADATRKAVVLAGRREVFCAGATLETLRQIAAGQTDVKDFLLPSYLLGFPLPLIAALEGHAVGGGLMLALCCDLQVASESSRYGVHFTTMGFTPGMGAFGLLPQAVGPAFAAEMILTGKLYLGRELAGRRLFNHIVPGHDVLRVARDLAARIAEKPRHVVELVKQALALPRRQALDDSQAREHRMHRICFAHAETIASIEENYLQ